MAQAQGTIVQCIGAVTDIQFDREQLPGIYEALVLEDALCLVFLERQLKELADKTAEDKVINALRKSWKKMTPAGHTLALGLKLGPREQSMVQRALNPGET